MSCSFSLKSDTAGFKYIPWSTAKKSEQIDGNAKIKTILYKIKPFPDLFFQKIGLTDDVCKSRSSPKIVIVMSDKLNFSVVRIIGSLVLFHHRFTLCASKMLNA